MSDPSALERRQLGWGVSCRPVEAGAHERDLELAHRGGLDLAVVGGRDNLVQGLELAITTALGADPFDVAFGFAGLEALADGASRVDIVDRLRLALVSTLERDARVGRVLDVAAEHDGRGLHLTAELAIVAGDIVRLNVAVPLTS